MRTIYLFVLLSYLLSACNSTPSNESPVSNTSEERQKEDIKQAEVPPTKKPPKEDKPAVGDSQKPFNASIEGYYVGMFDAKEYKENKRPSYSNKITFSIDSLSENKIFGHSIVAGNMRPFEGEFAHKNGVITTTCKEPGDDKYDGVFRFNVFTKTDKIEGTWESYDTNLAVTKRSYNLGKRGFSYDSKLELPEKVSFNGMYDSYDMENRIVERPTKDVLTLNASAQLLKKVDVENMYKADLEIIRNSIYARHGYSFKNRRMRYVFDDYVDWYMPIKTNILADLTELEKKNIELLKRYEGHAEKYYDTFGR
ncbi:MAG: YARHG domain-containing protein [Chitinophagales bacterium]